MSNIFKYQIIIKYKQVMKKVPEPIYIFLEVLLVVRYYEEYEIRTRV
jgi:hypothetical protein